MPTARLFAGTGLFSEVDHDPAAVLESVRVPILALWGERDTLVPPAESARIFQAAARRSGNHSMTTRFIPGGGHNGHLSADGFAYQGGLVHNGKPLGALGPGYADTITAWVAAVTSGDPPASSAEPAPVQSFDSRAASTGVWYEATGLQLGLLAGLLLAFAAYPVTALARNARFTADTATRPLRRLARWLAGLGFVTVSGTVAYLLWTFTTGGKVAPPVVGDRSLPWSLLQLLALAAAVVTVTFGVAGWRARALLGTRLRIRLMLLLCAAVVLLPWAGYWRLLAP
ncbi:alpha/beta hydrolase family protein [Nocardia sp. NPDC127579]|uniref:alpha/beta hydrolase family protein n=1 Tax=Nocardia sp. NPDC127579 TaxID=3345402 RepID=UPI0036308E0C